MKKNAFSPTGLLAAALSVFALCAAQPAAAAVIYFTDLGKIERVNSDGSGLTTLVTGLSVPVSIAIDQAHGKMYWTDPGVGKVQRANLDGSGVEDLVVSFNTFSTNGVALDPVSGQMYFSVYDGGPGRIFRANLDGSGLSLLPIAGLMDPNGVALDLASGKLYWTDSQTGLIQRANLDGSNVETVASSNDPSGIALDLGAGTFYWSDFIPAGNRTIRSANLDGSNAHVVVSGLGDPGGIALATLDGAMYFADTSSGRIYMSALDGSDMSVLVEGLSRAQGLAVISVVEPSAAFMLIAGFVVMRLSRKRINRA